MAETNTRSPSQPAVVLGLTFLAIGLTFALPYRLVPQAEDSIMFGRVTPEVVNVYACVAWAGWAHFLYAFRGQGNALAKVKDTYKNGRFFAYLGCIAATILVLLGVRTAIGAPFFGALVWVYFIDHFIKAEQAFEGKSRPSESFLSRWLASYQPLLTFGWLSIVLLNVRDVNAHPWVLWVTSLVLGAVVLIFGGWKNLAGGDARSPLISLFFVAEALVWGTVSQYGGQIFLTGVYVFHIAAGSYFHYFGSYFVGNARSRAADRLLNPLAILAVNAAIIGLGYVSARNASLGWLNPILGIQWFTLWVAVHLVLSDVFPAIKAWRFTKSSSPDAQISTS